MEQMSLIAVKSLDSGGGEGGDISRSEVISRDNNVLQNSKAYTDEKTPKDYIESVEKDTENQQIKLTDNKGNETSFNYGGGSGTSDYEDLINLPKINNITLTGNKSGIELGISRLIESEENQTVHGYSVPKLTAENITAIHNSVVAGIPTFVTDATGTYTYYINQADGNDEELYVVLTFCDVMILTYKLVGDTVETTYKEFGGGEPAAYLKSIEKNAENQTITVTDKDGNVTSFSYGGAVDEKPYWYKHKKLDYLYEIGYFDLDYDFAKDYFQKYRPSNVGACSSIAKNGVLARNYDWLYNEEVTFIVQTPHTLTRYASFGVASGVFELTREFVESGEISDAYKVLPFFMNDGVNEHGLSVSTNVTPDEKGNNKQITPTSSALDTICTLMLPRYILDNFKTAEEAIDYLTNHIALYTPTALLEMGYNQHFIITDGVNTYVIEFNEGAYIVRDDINYLTNFYAADVNFNSDGTVYTPADVPSGNKPSDNGITAYGQGLERWNIIANDYNELTMDIDELKSLLDRLKYTRTYSRLTNPFWYSECLTATIDNNNPPAAFEDIVDSMIAEYARRTRDGATWESVHSAIYDYPNGKFYVCSEEDTWFTYDLWSVGDGTNNYESLSNKPKINGVVLTGDKSLSDIGALPDAGAGTAHRAYTVLSAGTTDMRELSFEPKGRAIPKYSESGRLTSNNPINNLDVVNKQSLNAELLKKLDIAWGEENANKLLVVNSDGNIALRENEEGVAVSYWNLPVTVSYYTHDRIYEETINSEVLEYKIAENEYLYTIKFKYSTKNESLIVDAAGSMYQTAYVLTIGSTETDFADAMCNNVVLSLNDNNQWVVGTNNEPSRGIFVNFKIGKATNGVVTAFTINGYGQVVSNAKLLENGTPIVKALSVKLASGGAVVDSINGRTGDVILTKDDVGLSDVDNTSDEAKKFNFSGDIALGDDGFITGDDIYNALLNKQDKAKLIEAWRNQTINDYEVPYLTADDMHEIYNSVSSGISTYVIDATTKNIHPIKQVYKAADDIVIYLDYGDIMILTYSFIGGDVTTSYKEIGGGSDAFDYEDLINKPKIGGVELTGNKSVDDIGALPKAGADTVHRAYTVLSTGVTEMREVSYFPKERAIPKYSETGQLKSNNPITATDVINKQFLDIMLENKQDTLVSGTNIKTINGGSILGEGDIIVTGEPEAYLKTVTKDTENQTITITDKSDNEVTFEYGKGGEGTTDYENLINKPQIGGVELYGNKSLTDLGAVSEAPNDDFQYARRNGEWSRIGESVKFVTYTFDGEKLMNGDVPLTWEELYEKCNDNNFDVAINYEDCPFEPAPVRMLGLKWYYLLEGELAEDVIEFTAYSSNFRSIMGSDIQVTFRVKYDRFTETTSYEFINKLPSVWAVDVPGLIDTVIQYITPNQGTSLCYIKKTNTEFPAKLYEINTNAAEGSWTTEIDFGRGLFPIVLDNYSLPIDAGRGMTFRKRKYPISNIQYDKWLRGTSEDIDAGLSVAPEPVKDNGEQYLCYSDHAATAINENKTDDIVEVEPLKAKQSRRFSTILGSSVGAETIINPNVKKRDVEFLVKRSGSVLIADANWVGIPYYRGDKFIDIEINDNGICLVTDGETLVNKGFVDVEYLALNDDYITP